MLSVLSFKLLVCLFWMHCECIFFFKRDVSHLGHTVMPEESRAETLGVKSEAGKRRPRALWMFCEPFWTSKQKGKHAFFH